MKGTEKGNFGQRHVAGLLRKLHKHELRVFGKFLVFKGSGAVVRLWGIIRLKYPKFKIMDKAIFEQLFPNKQYNDNHLRVQLAELSSLTKDFFAYQEYQRDKLRLANIKAAALAQRKAYRDYLKEKQKNLWLKNSIQLIVPANDCRCIVY